MKGEGGGWFASGALKTSHPIRPSTFRHRGFPEFVICVHHPHLWISPLPPTGVAPTQSSSPKEQISRPSCNPDFPKQPASFNATGIPAECGGRRLRPESV